MIKQRIYHLVDKGDHGSRINLVFDYLIMTLIILNILAMIIDSSINLSDQIKSALKTFEIFSVIIFTIEYLMRIYVSDITNPSSNRLKSIIKFAFSFYGLIDLLAILPFYLPFLIPIDLRFIRVLRLMRFFRILKINRYNNSLTLIWCVVKDKKTELAVTGFIAILILFIASFFMYYIEGQIQPEKFPNILSCFWWAIATMTTIGYGDVFPVTGLGKFISGLIAIIGIGLVALPTGLISAGFIDKINQKKQDKIKCPNCGVEIS